MVGIMHVPNDTVGDPGFGVRLHLRLYCACIGNSVQTDSQQAVLPCNKHLQTYYVIRVTATKFL